MYRSWQTRHDFMTIFFHFSNKLISAMQRENVELECNSNCLDVDFISAVKSAL